jgi:hypothetical protein
MTAINWLLSAAAWLQTDGRWDLVTLGLAFGTFIYVGVAIASSIRSDIHARGDRAKANARIASVKRTTAKSRPGPET